PWGMRFIYSQETSPLGTGGAIRKALPHLSGPTFILNGDILCKVDFTALMKAHRQKKADGTLTLVTVPDPTAFGLIERDKLGRIVRFIEKPSASEITVNTINAGFYLFELSLIRQIPEGKAVSIERDVFPKLGEKGMKLFGYLHQGYWKDI